MKGWLILLGLLALGCRTSASAPGPGGPFSAAGTSGGGDDSGVVSGPDTDSPSYPGPGASPDAGAKSAPSGADRHSVSDERGCHTDEDCGHGQVCESCGPGTPGECLTGCRTDADCARGETCERVDCIRCPCPNECHAR